VVQLWSFNDRESQEEDVDQLEKVCLYYTILAKNLFYVFEGV